MGHVSIYYLFSWHKPFSSYRVALNPFRILGVSGILTILFIWTFDWLWTSMNIFTGDKHSVSLRHPFAFVSLAFLLINLYLLYRKFLAMRFVDFTGLSFVVFTAALLLFQHAPAAGMLVFNAWLLLIGILYIRQGAAQNHLGLLNFGLCVILLLSVFRFFDSNIPFVWRGLIFIAVGVGFFAGNLFVIRKRREPVKENSL